MKNWLIILCVAASIAIGGYFYYQQSTGRNLKIAEQAQEAEEWTKARVFASKHLLAHPQDTKATLLLAEATIKDDSLNPQKSLDQAVELLQAIELTADNAAIARLRLAEVLFVEKGMSVAAENAVRESIELDSESVDAHRLLWRILCATSRSFEAEPNFVAALENSPPELHREILVDWFNSQYVRPKFNYPVDNFLGVLAPGQPPTSETQLDRLIVFRNAEMDEPQAIASVAIWFQDSGDSKTALKLLTPFLDLENSFQSNLFVNCAVATFFEMGQFDRAKELLAKWPEERKGDFYYLQWEGIIAQDGDRDFDKAAEFFEESTKVWPGNSDQTVHFRLEKSLRRLGKVPQAEAAKIRTAEIETIMSADNLKRIQNAVENSDKAENVGLIADFYEGLNRPIEARYWRNLEKEPKIRE